MTAATVFHLETDLDAGTPRERQASLGLLEAMLVKSSSAARSIDQPTLAYFVDMAIAELRTMSGVVEPTLSPARGPRPS